MSGIKSPKLKLRVRVPTKCSVSLWGSGCRRGASAVWTRADVRARLRGGGGSRNITGNTRCSQECEWWIAERNIMEAYAHPSV